MPASCRNVGQDVGVGRIHVAGAPGAPLPLRVATGTRKGSTLAVMRILLPVPGKDPARPAGWKAGGGWGEVVFSCTNGPPPPRALS
eukprot:76877-Prorocentrum_lima.AAC.1